jgi:cell division protein FtsW
MIKSYKNSIIIIICTLILVITGVVMVYSASKYSASLNYDNKFFYMKKQLIGAILGLGGMVATSFINHKIYKKFYIVAYMIGVVLLAIVFVPGLSKSSYGATRWVNLGFFTIQPSEIAKFCLVLFLSAMLSKGKDINKPSKLLSVLFGGVVYCVLIMLEPNMSITICVGLTLVAILFIGGLNIKTFAIGAIPIILLGVGLVVLEPYRMKRIVAFIDPWENPLEEGYQLIQSLYAISSGGLFGVGLGNSRQAQLFLPFAESDFIFSIICEELGFIGGIAILLVYLTLIITIIKVGLKATDHYSKLLCIGIACVLGIQTVLNVCVVSGSIPPTGLPLPFISAGSTSLLVFMSAIGVVLNVDRQSRNARI